MKKNPFAIAVILLFFLTGLSCHTAYQSAPLQYKTYQLPAGLPAPQSTLNLPHRVSVMQADSSTLNLRQRYSEQMNRTMNDVVGVATFSLEKNLPECTL